ncbi:hypothetical protein ACQ4M3_08245 [Leptolyngbya sp. AN03gr2]|uniref:hypothetical protein n=1 Tax=unclassified Leptolyngbya TaxID=2650499 RepID=UPI003D3155C7
MTISATLSQADRDAIAQAITTIQKHLPFLIDLVAEERSSLPKLSPKSRSFVSTALNLASHNPDFLPRSFDVEEMRQDLELFQDLNQILMSLTQLHDMVDDTCMLVGSQTYTAALTVYDYAKKSGMNANGMEPIVAEMREHFRRSRKSKPSEEKSATVSLN